MIPDSYPFPESLDVGALLDQGYDTLIDALAGVGLVFLLIGLLCFILLTSFLAALARKAGYSGWWALTMYVPIVNFVLAMVFVSVEWPIQRRAAEAERELHRALYRNPPPPH